MIKIVNLSKFYGKKKVLDNISFDILDGETLAIIGPSGCGKSTLLRLLIRLDEPTNGKIYIDGQDISRLSEDGLIRLRERIGMVFQSSALFDSLTVFENVAFALREHEKHSEIEIEKIVKEKLEVVELKGVEDLLPYELSGGMQKRVGVARALAFSPKIILYDEPTTGLDPITSVTIENLINKLSKELKVTSILVTHQLTTVFRTSSRIVMLHEGKFIETGTVDETKKSKNEIVRSFITAGLNSNLMV
jgi:phospholipid/cholesterol/gamma-HCH transport system ATP-binding protein